MKSKTPPKTPTPSEVPCVKCVPNPEGFVPKNNLSEIVFDYQTGPAGPPPEVFGPDYMDRVAVCLRLNAEAREARAKALAEAVSERLLAEESGESLH